MLCLLGYIHVHNQLKGPFNNYVTPRGGKGVEQCATDRSQHNVKKHYEGWRGMKDLSKK